MLHALGLHIDSGRPVDPTEGQRWLASPVGTRFVTQSSTAWCGAAIAAGEAPAAARAAANRTTAAYTGVPAD